MTWLASVSATPYMNTVNSSAAATNQATPVAVMWNVAAPERREPDQDGDLERGKPDRDDQVSEHQIGRAGPARRAARAARREWRSTSTLSPAKMQLSGITRPTAPTPTNEV